MMVFFCDVRYGVGIQYIISNGKVKTLIDVPVFIHVDGCFVSDQFSVSKRRNRLFLTKSFAEYIILDIESWLSNLRVDIEITRSENLIPGIAQRTRSERIEEDEAYEYCVDW